MRGDERKSRKVSLIVGDKHLGIERSDIAEMLLVRAAQSERIFTGSGEHQSIGKLDAGFQRIFLNEN